MNWSRPWWLVLLAACTLPMAFAENPQTISGETSVIRDLPDPIVVEDGGTYYAYGTSDAGRGFRCHSSTDLIHWVDRGFVFQKTDQSWGKDHFWAPHVLKHEGKWYLFYNSVGPVEGRNSHRICVAKADSPLGPFTDVKTPLFDPGYACIDADVFVDTDGQPYLYFVRDISENPVSEIQVVKLSPDLLSIEGDIVACARPSQPWEGEKWNEAPHVFKKGPTYVLMYSANGFFSPSYAVGYATSESPMGPWKKARNNPILEQSRDVVGTGHNCLIALPKSEEMLIAYHAHRTPTNRGKDRDMHLSKISIELSPSNKVRIKPVRIEEKFAPPVSSSAGQ